MTKVITFFLVLVLIITGCGESDSSNSSSTVTQVPSDPSPVLEMQTFFEVTSGSVLSYVVPINGVEYALIGAPAFISINTATGEISASPGDGDVGDHFFQVNITTANQEVITKEIKISVYMKYANFLTALPLASALTIENLLPPVATNDTAEQAIVPNPNGIDWNILKPYRKQYWENESLVMIDTASGAINTLHIPESNTYNFKFLHSTIANNKLIISGQAKIPDPTVSQFATKWTTKIHVYDPATNTTELDAIQLPANVVPSSHFIEKGINGKIYGMGLYDPDTHYLTCYEIDMDAYEASPSTYVARDFGRVGYAQTLLSAQAKGIFADATHVYLVEGTKPYYLIAIDIATGTQTKLMETTIEDGFIELYTSYYGATVKGTNLINGLDDGEYFLFKGGLTAVPLGSKPEDVTPPWSNGTDGKNYVYGGKVDEVGLPPKPEIEYSLAARGAADKTIWYRRAADIGSGGDTPLKAGWKEFNFTTDVFTQNLQRLDTLSDGRLFGAAVSYGGMFFYDPLNNTSVFAGQYGLSHYSTTVVGNYVYVSGYPNGPLYEFDITQPINREGLEFNTLDGSFSPILGSDTSGDLNPRFIGHLESVAGIHKIFTSTEGLDSKVYFGGKFERNGNGGGLAWYDRTTNSFDGYSTPFANNQIINMTSTLDKNYIVLSTLGVNTETEGKIYVVSSSTNQIVSTFKPTPKASSTGFIVGVSDTEIIGLTYDKADINKAYLYKLNILTGQIVKSREIVARVAFVNDTNQLIGKGLKEDEYGSVWTYLDGTLVKISADLDFQIIGKVNDTLGDFAFQGDHVYLTGKDVLRRIQYK